MRSPTLVRIIFCATFIVVVDLALKQLLPDVVINQGIGLGLLSNFPTVLIHITFLFIVGVIASVAKDARLNQVFMFVSIVSLSNFVDRIFLSGVRDYLVIFNIWFNLADLAIVIGLLTYIGMLIYDEIYSTSRASK